MNISNPVYRRRRRGFSTLSKNIIQPPISPDPQDHFSVSGTITGPIVEGVIVYVLDSSTRSVVGSGLSDISGYYTIGNLPSNVTYDILPVINDHTSTPHLSQVTLTDNTTQDFLLVAGGQYLYDDTTISIVDDQNNRLWELTTQNLGFPYTFPITLT